jgi:acyl carrier protein
MIVPWGNIAHAAATSTARMGELPSAEAAERLAASCHRGGIELKAPVRYTKRPLGRLGRRRPPPTHEQPWRRQKALRIIGLSMSATYETVANIIAETCDIPRDKIKPESHAINDLGIDSLDFLDIAFAIDKTFGIKMPLEQWTQEVNEGRATTEQYFVLQNLSTRIDELVAAKKA